MSYRARASLYRNNHHHERKYHRRGVSQDEIAELREAFDLFDTEKTGTIEITELKHSMNALSYDRKNKMIHQILNKLDNLKQDRIDFEEFLDLMTARISDKDSKENINKVFELFDDDGKGHITVEDLKKVAINLGEEMSDEELKEMIDRADTDNKGYVNTDEFFNIMTKKTFT
eukprot:85060_1